MNSLSEENYLKAIYKLREKNNAPITTNAIAEAMDTKASSVTDMLKKLSAKDLIHYRKYQGVRLTSRGEKTALMIIRKHRLWEMFLVKKLSFRWDEVHMVAEQLEHINSDKLIEQIDKLLDYPKFDPHGDPIPDSKGRIETQKVKLLSGLKRKSSGIMKGVDDHDPSFLRYLDKEGLALGCRIQVTDIIEYDRSLKISVDNKKELYISHEVAKNILIG